MRNIANQRILCGFGNEETDNFLKEKIVAFKSQDPVIFLGCRRWRWANECLESKLCLEVRTFHDLKKGIAYVADGVFCPYAWTS